MLQDQKIKLLDAVNIASGILEAAEFDDFLWQAKVIVAHVACIKPSQLHLAGDLDRRLLKKVLSLAEERVSGVPLQHVIGEWDFYGRTFKVDNRALIPRPETELLVEFVASSELPEKPLILDTGTGTGVIGISLALEIPESLVIGTDISRAALDLASENKRLLQAHNYSILNCNLADALDAQFDVIAANLPYISSSDIPNLPSLVKDHDPLLALDGGADGTLLILELVGSVPKKIKPGGLIVLETGFDQKDSVTAIFPEELWTDIQACNDLAGNHRIVTARRR